MLLEHRPYVSAEYAHLWSMCGFNYAPEHIFDILIWEENDSGNENKPSHDLAGRLSQYWLSRYFKSEKLRLKNVARTF